MANTLFQYINTDKKIPADITMGSHCLKCVLNLWLNLLNCAFKDKKLQTFQFFPDSINNNWTGMNFILNLILIGAYLNLSTFINSLRCCENQLEKYFYT